MISVILQSHPTDESGSLNKKSIVKITFTFEYSRDAVRFNRVVKKEIGYISSEIKKDGK